MSQIHGPHALTNTIHSVSSDVWTSQHTHMHPNSSLLVCGLLKKRANRLPRAAALAA